MAEKDKSEQKQKQEADREADRSASDIPLMEWIAAGIGALIVAALVAFLAVKAAHWDSSLPPMMRVEAKQVVRGAAGYVVQIEVVNSADATGANVQIEGKLTQGGSDVETSDAQIAYVPGHARVPAGLVFLHDPARYALALRVTGYEAP